MMLHGRRADVSGGPGLDAFSKRRIITDTLGLLLAAAKDSIAGQQLLEQAAADHPGLRKAWVDGDYRKHFVDHAAVREVVQRTRGSRGFASIPKRWTVERTGWLMLHRRLARDCETLPARSEAMIHLAMTDLMTRRLAGKRDLG
ncbi:hypothetical protein ACQEV2_43530 [Streptomyces sp. CA-251387]|uniref:hypothetical protein n=1 Tax=Streptomyces sp. CA-251387 TaxID=3240064 RepID=UPI003D8F1725